VAGLARVGPGGGLVWWVDAWSLWSVWSWWVGMVDPGSVVWVGLVGWVCGVVGWRRVVCLDWSGWGELVGKL
jgi:hypothetical protein